TSIDENTDTTLRIKVADIEIADDALGTNDLTLSGADATLFELDGLELFLKAGTVLDHQADSQLDVTVEVDDTSVGATPDATADLSITVTDINEAPTAVALNGAVTSIDENTDTTLRIKMADIEITDDALGTNDLTLSGADATLFELDGLELFLKSGMVLDHEGDSQLDVTVEVDDATVGATPDATADLSITVADINEPPLVALANTTTTLREHIDTSAPVKVADIFVSDDALGTFILSLAGADAGLFEIVGSELFLKANVGLDADVQAELNVTVQVDDPSLGTGADDSDALTIQILALGDLDGNGAIDTTDLVIFKLAFFTNDPVGDFNNDGIVNTIDLAIFKQAFLNAASSSSSTSSQTSAPLAASSATPELRAQTAAAPISGHSSAGSSVENPITPSRMVEQQQALDQSARTVPFSKAQPGHHIRVFGASGDGPSSDERDGRRFVYSSLAQRGSVLDSFESGSDVLDLSELLDGMGYTGSDPVADGWISLVTRGEDTVLYLAGDTPLGTRDRMAYLLIKNTGGRLSMADDIRF
ncbi:MAG: hypothetical protein GY701_18970, partial [Sulfitobacter sp.]|nr:hypothetical protein [Sulfitobacter sp.]